MHRFIHDRQPFVVCLQESKLTSVDEFIVKSIWGSDCCGYSYQAFVGASRGLLTLWDTSVVEVWCTISYRHLLIIKGMVLLSGQDFIIVNVYAPCDSSAKQELWLRLNQFIIYSGIVNVCVCGDFNFVRTSAERRGRNLLFRQVDADNFNNFIDGSFF